jgi:putative PEP-CTERM system TPR-repeat lipoprotein
MVEHVTGNVRAAMAGYDKAITLDADHMEARLARAGLYLDLDRPAEAAAEVEELRKRFPKEPRGAYLAALLAERKGDAQAAQARLREVTALLDAVPMDYIRYRPQVLMLNGLAHFGLSELEKAKPYFEALLPRAQTPLPALKPLAQIHLAERNPARAAELLEWYMRAHPSDLQAMVLLASAYVAKGQNTKAFDLLQEAMRNNDTPQMRSVLGMSLLGNGRWQDALPELEVAFKRDPRGQTYAGSMLAMLYLKNGQLPKAEAVAQALAKQDPSNPVFHNLLGMVLARTGNAAGARKAFEQALKIDDRLSAPKLNLARLDMNERAFDAAERRLTPLLKADDRNVDARLEAARLAALRGKDEDEQALLEKANELSTARDPRAGLALIALHLRRGKPAAAVDVAKRLASRRGEDVTVLLAYANAQNINGDTTGARSTLSKATTLAGYSAPRQIEIASLQLAAGNLPGARYSADKALSAVPDFLPAQALLVDLDLRQGDTAKAEQLARKITASHPQRAIGYSLLGDVAAARGQGAAALEGYRKAHQLEPNTESFLRLFKATSLQEGNEAGQRLAEAWVKTHPKDIRARKALADALARSGNLPAARSAYEALLKVSPDDAEAMNNLANLLLRAKDRAALEVAERALSLAPQNTNVIDTVGWAALQAGQPDRALQLLRDARLRDPANNEVRYHLAAVLAKAGRRNEAREELQAALRSGRPFDSVAEARSLMSTLD